MSRKRKVKYLFPPSEVSWAAIAFEREPDPFVFRFIIYFLSALFIVGIAFSSIAKMPISVTGEGKITSFDSPVPIRASSKMTVDKLSVTENQRVKKGQILLQSQEDLSKDDAELLGQILKELTSVMKMNVTNCPSCINRLRVASSLYLRLKTQGELMSVVTPLSDSTKEFILSLEEQKQLPYRLQDAALQISLNKKKLAAIRVQKAEGMLAKEVEALQTEIATNQTKINEKVEHVRERISAAKIQMSSQIAELKNRTQYLGKQYTVYAPFNGIVVSLNVKGAGELLQVGQVLLSLIPEKSPLIAELQIENRDLSDIAKNAKTTVTIDALPEYDYGYATGHVIDVIRKEGDPNRAMTGDRGLASAVDTPIFIARIALDQQSLAKNGVASPFITGMTVKGQVAVRTESILHIVIRSLFQTKDELQAAGNK